MSHPERCPSCYQKVGPDDFMCPRCELILQAQIDEVTAPNEVSVVRRMLERPQAGVPAFKPEPPPPLKKSSPEQSIGRTKMMAMPPSLDEIPRVVAGLRLACMDLTPFEAWVISGIDGVSAGKSLQNVVGLASMELRVVLQTLKEKGVISMEGPVASSSPADSRSQSTPQATVPAAPPPAPPATPRSPPPAKPRSQAAVSMLPEDQSLTQSERATDPRVAVSDGVQKNRKILDALKQVKRADPVAASASRPSTPALPRSVAGARSDSALQVALRMEQAGKLNEAINYLERAIDRSPDAGPLYNRLAVILVRGQGQLRKAEELLEKALELEPENAVYRQNLLKVIDKRANRVRR